MPHDLRRLLWPSRRLGGTRAERVCEHQGCSSPTEAQKPYCVEHYELNPYAREVLRKIEQRAQDDELVRRKGHQAAKPEATTAIEIMLYLRLRGERTFLRICRDLCLDKQVAWHYTTLLLRVQRIARTRSDRGVWKIRIRERPQEPQHAKPVGPWRVVSPRSRR